MEVITIDSIAFQKLVEQLNRIESYVERTTELYRDIDDALEISTKDLMTIFCISESTLYRWRKGGSISFRYTETGGVRFSYSSLFMAIKCFRIKIPGMAKEEALKRLSDYKDGILLNKCTTETNDRQGRYTGTYRPRACRVQTLHQLSGETRKNFRNPLYEDRIASCNIYYDRHAQVFKMKDFGNNEYSGDCFWFVGMLYGLDVKRDFVAIINRIVSDLNITIVHTGSNDMPARKKAVEKRIIMNDNDNPIRKDYHTEVKPFSVAELAYWQQYGIKPDTLERYNVHSLKSFEGYNRSDKIYKISSSATEPMFAYMGMGFTKVYRPRN